MYIFCNSENLANELKRKSSSGSLVLSSLEKQRWTLVNFYSLFWRVFRSFFYLFVADVFFKMFLSVIYKSQVLSEFNGEILRQNAARLWQ